MIEKTKDEIEKDYWYSNYKFKPVNSRLEARQKLINLHMKKLDRELNIGDGGDELNATGSAFSGRGEKRYEKN